jgi:hypothetical protein
MTRRLQTEARTQYIYDGSALVAVLEPVEDARWRVIVRGREVGIYRSREQAIAALDDESGTE